MKLLMLCGANPDEAKLAEGHLDVQSALVPWLGADTRVVQIGSWNEYNKWFVDGFKCPEIDESGFDFILNIESDATIANPEAWDSAFFDYDYIGAPWRLNWGPFVKYAAKYGKNTADYPVGNSGFCLMSSKFVYALRDLHPSFSDYGKDGKCDPCDWYLLVAKNELLVDTGIKIAPTSVAGRFAVERDVYRGQFGCHNWIGIGGRQISLKQNRYRTFSDLLQ